MKAQANRQRLYASLLILGAGVLLYRTLTMISQGAFEILAFWVYALIVVEMVIDLACLLSAAKWWFTKSKNQARIALRLGAAAAIFHAFRVLIFVMGRVGPWIDFDVQPEHRALHGTRWTWGEVYFASIMSILRVLVVIVIWRLIVRANKYSKST